MLRWRAAAYMGYRYYRRARRSDQKEQKIRLPDAIIWATAQNNSLLLISRNTKDFPGDDSGIRVPYEI